MPSTGSRTSTSSCSRSAASRDQGPCSPRRSPPTMGRVSTVAPVPRERCGLRASAPSVPRSRLLEQLDRLPGGGLALVVAPAGSGKSVLLSQWSRSRPDLRMATLSLTPRHDDAVAFARDLATALRPVLPQVGSRLDDAVMTGGSVLGERFVSQLTDELAAAPPGLAIILDDLHLLTNASVVAGLERLVTETPVTTRWVIAARWDPALHLARLRVDDRLVELRAEHLAFDEAEAHELIEAVAHRDVPADSVRTLVDRTDGWAAGLQLASISLRDVEDPAAFVTDFAGTDRLVVEYLTQEVLDRQDPHAYRFLLDTSVLPWLSAELCDAVTGRADSREQLNRLVEQSLFVVPLDRGRDRFRYHPLFADLLHYRLDAERPESIASLHEAAARWLRTRGEHTAAIEELLAAGAPLAAFDVVAEEGQSLFERGESATLAGWLTQIRHQVPTPPATLEVSLLAAQVAADQVGAASETYRQLRRRLDLTLGEQATADALYTCLGFDDLPSEEVLKASDNVRAILPLVTRRSVPDFLGVGGYDSVQFMAEFMASVAHFHHGDLGAAMARLERTSTLPGMSYSVWRIYLLGLRGLVLASSGRLTEADQQVQACLTAADDAGLRAREFSTYAYQAAAICAIDRHHLDEAEHLLAESALRNQLRHATRPSSTSSATWRPGSPPLGATTPRLWRSSSSRPVPPSSLLSWPTPPFALAVHLRLRASDLPRACALIAGRPSSTVPPVTAIDLALAEGRDGDASRHLEAWWPDPADRRASIEHRMRAATVCEAGGDHVGAVANLARCTGLGRDRAAPSPVPRSANPGAAPSRPGQEQHREVRAVAARRVGDPGRRPRRPVWPGRASHRSRALGAPVPPRTAQQRCHRWADVRVHQHHQDPPPPHLPQAGRGRPGRRRRTGCRARSPLSARRAPRVDHCSERIRGAKGPTRPSGITGGVDVPRISRLVMARPGPPLRWPPWPASPRSPGPRPSSTTPRSPTSSGSSARGGWWPTCASRTSCSSSPPTPRAPTSWWPDRCDPRPTRPSTSGTCWARSPTATSVR